MYHYYYYTYNNHSSGQAATFKVSRDTSTCSQEWGVEPPTQRLWNNCPTNWSTVTRFITRRQLNKTRSSERNFPHFTKFYFLGKIISSISQHFIWQQVERWQHNVRVEVKVGWGWTLFSCSSSAGRRCCRVCGSTAPRCLASPSSPSGPWRRTRPPRSHRPWLQLHPSLEGGNLVEQTHRI